MSSSNPITGGVSGGAGGGDGGLDRMLCNKMIRSYLKHFSESQWDRVLKCTVMYGIQSLQAHHRVERLDVAQLEELVVSNAAALGVEDTVPSMQATLSKLEADIERVRRELGGAAAGRHVRADEEEDQPEEEEEEEQKKSAPKKKVKQQKEAKPKAAAAAASVYPDWWPGATAAKGRKTKSARERPPPRLAYSVAAPADRALLRDDLVTAKYRAVPAKVDAGPPARRTAWDPAAGRPRLHTPPKHLKHVPSKIQAKVRRDRQLFQRGAGGAREEEDVVGVFARAPRAVRPLPGEGRQAKKRARRRRAAQHRGEAVQIADSFLESELFNLFGKAAKKDIPVDVQVPERDDGGEEKAAREEEEVKKEEEEEKEAWRPSPAMAALFSAQAKTRGSDNGDVEAGDDGDADEARRLGSAWLGEFGSPHTWTVPEHGREATLSIRRAAAAGDVGDEEQEAAVVAAGGDESQ